MPAVRMLCALALGLSLLVPLAYAEKSEAPDSAESGKSGKSAKDKAESGKDKSDAAKDKAESGKDKSDGGKDKADAAPADAAKSAEANAPSDELQKVKAAARQAARKATLAAADAAKARAAAVSAAASAAAAREVPPLPPEPARPSQRSASASELTTWAYEGDNGPAAWADLAPEFASCGKGERQSPIDIREGIKLELDPLVFDYRESSFKVIDTGHTIQANLAGGNFLKVMGRRFSLIQFHFHRPAEELVDGHQAEMVLHMVHKDAAGKLAVVAVELERGERQAEIQSVWNNLPLEKNEEQPASTKLNPARLLPEDRRYFTYMGSLTTPPCTEGVLWLVLKQPVQLSAEQIELFARLYPLNARPVQASAGRMIKESN